MQMRRIGTPVTGAVLIGADDLRGADLRQAAVILASLLAEAANADRLYHTPCATCRA